MDDNTLESRLRRLVDEATAAQAALIVPRQKVEQARLTVERLKEEHYQAHATLLRAETELQIAEEQWETQNDNLSRRRKTLILEEATALQGISQSTLDDSSTMPKLLTCNPFVKGNKPSKPRKELANQPNDVGDQSTLPSSQERSLLQPSREPTPNYPSGISRNLNVIHLSDQANDEKDDDYFNLTERMPSSVVQRPDGVFVELRCPECGSNSTAARKRASFYKGVGGFKLHYMHAHRSAIPTNLDDLKKISFYEHRIFTPAEVDAMKKKDSLAPIIPHIHTDIAANSQMISSTDDAGIDTSSDTLVAERARLHAKRYRTAPGTYEEHDSDNDLHDAKRQGVNQAPSLAMNNAMQKPNFAEYCPCSLSDHFCSNLNCKLKKVCRAEFHNMRCIESHDVRPSCIDYINGSCNNMENCRKGHDHRGERTSIYVNHVHYKH